MSMKSWQLMDAQPSFCRAIPFLEDCIGVGLERVCPVLTPDIKRQRVSLFLASTLLQHVESRKLGQVLQAPYGVMLAKTLIRPDMLFIARERIGILGNTGVYAAPDLVVDILSSQLPEKQFRVRKKVYAFFEIREYWIVDPDTATIEVMIWSELGYVTVGRYGMGDRLSSPLMPGLMLPVSRVFF
jgi:Uma2 family endonuclease